MGSAAAELREEPYDLVLDLQGLLKSALWARQAIGPVAGYDAASAREAAAALVVPAHGRGAAAATCMRWSVAAPGRRPPGLCRCRPRAPDFGLQAPRPTWAAPERYAVLIPNASRPEKLWPERAGWRSASACWTNGLETGGAVGQPAEQTLAERIAAGCDGDVPPFLKVREMAAVLAGAQTVVGPGHRLHPPGGGAGPAHHRHLLRPRARPGRRHRPGPVHSLGGKGQVPKLADVLALLESAAWPLLLPALRRRRATVPRCAAAGSCPS
jgi:heptosyltransferase-1